MDNDGDGLDEVVSELVQADLDGYHPLLGPAQIRLRSDLPSLGVITEQVNSMLWVGQFEEADWKWHDTGQLYAFPRTDRGAIRYGNVEGVGWITQKRIVTVSDKRKKKTQPDKTLTEKDQSIHIFEIPE